MRVIAQELELAEMRSFELESARTLGNTERTKNLELEIKNIHEKIADSLVEKGYASQFVAQMTEQLITHKYALFHEPVKLLGGYLMKQAPWIVGSLWGSLKKRTSGA